MMRIRQTHDIWHVIGRRDLCGRSFSVYGQAT